MTCYIVKFLKQFIENIINYQIEYAIGEKALPKSASGNFEVVMPKIGYRDLQRSAGAFGRIAASLSQLVEKGILSTEIANRVVVGLMVELDLLEEAPGESTIGTLEPPGPEDANITVDGTHEELPEPKGYKHKSTDKSTKIGGKPIKNTDHLG